jgi:hypothetical protein
VDVVAEATTHKDYRADALARITGSVGKFKDKVNDARLKKKERATATKPKAMATEPAGRPSILPQAGSQD